MINIQHIATMELSADTLDFMDTYGGNHVSLYRGWKAHPGSGEDPVLLEGQLAYAIQQHNFEVTKRILGRIRRVVSEREDQMLREVWTASEAEPLGILG